jgi:hypothetical protein
MFEMLEMFEMFESLLTRRCPSSIPGTPRSRYPRASAWWHGPAARSGTAPVQQGGADRAASPVETTAA